VLRLLDPTIGRPGLFKGERITSVLRELNRKLGLALPLGGPKTLNGLILEHLRDIPEAGVALKIAEVPMEIVQTQDRVIRTVRLFRPRVSDLAKAA